MKPIALFLTSVATLTFNVVPALANPCADIKSTTQILDCAESQAPDVLRAAIAVERASATMTTAAQRPNPELSADSFHGTVDGGRASETEVSLSIPFELGGKRKARIASAEAASARAQAALVSEKANARTTVLLKLHRLRQLAHEKEVIEESIGTFSKLVSQYSARPTLSPEQQMTLSVFRLSKSEYELRRTSTLGELAELERFFTVYLGLKVEQIRSFLPPAPTKWPPLFTPSGTSLRLRLLDAELTSAQALLSVAESDAWPTLTIGPSLKLQTEQGRSDQLLGFNLSFPIPILNRNQGAKAEALSEIRLAESNKRLVQAEEDAIRGELRRTYEESMKVLTTSLTHAEIEQKHRQMEQLFLRGIVPSSLVIEAHRNYVELESLRNERELKAIEAFALLSALNGRPLEAL